MEAIVKLRIDNQTHLGPLNAADHSDVFDQITQRLTFPNPAFEAAERLGFSTWSIPNEIKGYLVSGSHLIIPRGFTAQLIGILRGTGVHFKIEDNRRTLPEVDFQFDGELRDFQETAVNAMAARDFGTLAAATGSGKTVMALALIALRKQPALVIVHTKELADQWVSRIGTFMGIPAGEVGRIGGGKMVVGDRITVGLVQSIFKIAPEIAPHIGNLIIDECHRAPSRTFTECVTAFDSKFMTGLSATPYRRDGLSRLIFWSLGDVIHEVDKDALVEAGHVLSADVTWRETSFSPTYDPTTEYSRMLSELTQNGARNALIASDVAKEAGNGGGVCLVLSDRRAHCEALQALLARRGIEAHLLTGELSNGERQAVVEALNAGKVRVLVGTISLLSEGFDSKNLSTLFLCTPIKFNGRLIQCLGRVLRPAPGKEKAKVYDYLDPVGVLENAAKGRERVYATGM